MIRTVLRMRVYPGREAELERRFAELDVLGAAARVAGLRSGELLRPRDGGTYVVTGTWDSLEAYQVWQQSAVRQQIGAALEGVAVPGADTEVHDVVQAYPLHQGSGRR